MFLNAKHVKGTRHASIAKLYEKRIEVTRGENQERREGERERERERERRIAKGKCFKRMS